LNLRTDIVRFTMWCWMLLLPVASFAANDSLGIKEDTVAISVREPDMNLQDEVYTNEDYNYEEESNKSSSEDGFFDRLLQDLIRSLFEDDNNYSPRPGIKPPGAGGMPSINWWYVLFIILGGGLIVFFIIKATSAGGSLVFKGKTKRKEEKIDATLEDVDIHAITYESEIAKAVAQQDYRFAVRLWFLRSLKELTDKNFISWKIDKTNSDYYYELSGSKLQKQFGSVSLLYDYVWYGEFGLDELKYRDAEKELHGYFSEIQKSEGGKS